MNADPYLFDWIDDFLGGKLSPEDQVKMEDAILKHTDLAQEVKFRKLEFDIAESLIASDIIAQLAQLRQQPTPSQPASKRVGMAVLLLLLICFVAWLVFHFTTPSPLSTPPQVAPSGETKAPTLPFQEDIVPPVMPPVVPQDNRPRPIASDISGRLALATSFYKRPDVEDVRGREMAMDSFDILLNAWHENDFISVIRVAEKVNTASPLYIKAQYLLGHAYFLSHKYSQATLIFGKVADSKMMPYAEEADWYIILALLSEKKINRSALDFRVKAILDTPNHTYFEECKMLSEKL